MPLPAVDPAAAWANWEVAVTVAGRRVRIPPHPAADWLLAAWRGGGMKYLLELGEPEDTDWMVVALLDGELDDEAVEVAGRDALEMASGWRWWIAENLMLGAGASWPQIGGELLLRGVRVQTVTLGEFLAAAYAALTRHHKKEDVDAFDQKLATPPAGVGAVGAEAMEEMATQMFGQMFAGG